MGDSYPLGQYYKSSTHFESSGYSCWLWEYERDRICFIGTRGTMLFGEYVKVPTLCKNIGICMGAHLGWCGSGHILSAVCLPSLYTLPWACGDLNSDGMWNYCCASNQLSVGSCHLRSHVFGQHLLSGPCWLSHNYSSCATPQWV